MSKKITRRFFVGTVALGGGVSLWAAQRQPPVAQTSLTGRDVSPMYFATVNDAQAAAEAGRIVPGDVVMVLHNSVVGDRGGFTALVIDPQGRGPFRSHPQATRLALLEDEPTPEMFGTAVDSQAGVQRWLDWGGGLSLERPILVSGQVSYRSNTLIKGRPGATLQPTEHAKTGTFLTNRDVRTPVLSPVRGLVLEDVDISGASYPMPVYFQVVRSRGRKMVLPASASDVDGFYVQMFVHICEGAEVAQRRLVMEYDGASRTATLNRPFKATQAGDAIVVGSNANAFAAIGGSRDIHVVRGRFSDFEQISQVPFSGGGKGVNFESGVTNGRITDSTFSNCTTAVFFQGIDETYKETGIARSAVHLRAEGIHAENCGSLLTFAGTDRDQIPDGNPSTQMVSADDLTYRNCGHAPLRIVGRDQQKNGIVNLLEAQNFRITNVSGYNTAGYPQVAPGYPTDFPTRVGYGLSGPVGAMIWGHGRHGIIDDFTHHGDVDAVVRLQRCRALGDDAAGQGGQARNCFDLEFTALKLYGRCQHVVAVDVPVRRIPADELTGTIEAVVDDIQGGICGPNMEDYHGLLLDVTERSSGRRVIGTPAQIMAVGNRTDALAYGVTDLRAGQR